MLCHFRGIEKAEERQGSRNEFAKVEDFDPIRENDNVEIQGQVSWLTLRGALHTVTSGSTHYSANWTALEVAADELKLVGRLRDPEPNASRENPRIY